MCVCMYVYVMEARTCATLSTQIDWIAWPMHMYMYTDVCVCVWRCICPCICACVHLLGACRMHVCMCIHVYLRVCLYTSMYVCTWRNMLVVLFGILANTDWPAGGLLVGRRRKFGGASSQKGERERERERKGEREKGRDFGSTLACRLTCAHGKKLSTARRVGNRGAY